MQLRLWGSQLRLKLAQIGLSTKKKPEKKESPQSLVTNTTLGDVASLAAVSLSRASCQPSKLYMINVVLQLHRSVREHVLGGLRTENLAVGVRTTGSLSTVSPPASPRGGWDRLQRATATLSDREPVVENQILKKIHISDIGWES